MDPHVSDKGKKRNQSRDAAKNKEFATKEERSLHWRKVHKRNLGQKKQTTQRATVRSAFANESHHALNELLAQQPKRVIVKDLSPMRGKAKGKKMLRTVSLWMRSVLNERASFKTQARGSCLEAVASAYTSQECSHSGFTAEDNRAGDYFRCLNCGMVDTADGNAAKVTGKRFTDPEMKPWMNKFRNLSFAPRNHNKFNGIKSRETRMNTGFLV